MSSVDSESQATPGNPGAVQAAVGTQMVPLARAPGRPWMSPLTRRRWANFRANKRGYWSLQLFIVLFVLTLLAEVIANDRPLLIMYGGSLYSPVLMTYAEKDFGGEFETEADYKDQGVQALIEGNGGWMLWPLIPFSYNTIDYYLPGPAPYPPSAEHWFGTDTVGKDVVAQLIYGARLSFLFGIVLTALSSVIGVTAGAVQGYFGGKVDLIAQRFVEIWAGLPMLFILIILASVVESNVYWLLGILVAFSWMSLVGVVRIEFLRGRNFQYVAAARALGATDLRIMVRHVLPNGLVATFTFLPFILTGSITLLTSLDFLGFGLPADSPSLGRLLAQGRTNIHAPWLGLTTVFTLALMLTLLIFAGEAVRDAFDPRKDG